MAQFYVESGPLQATVTAEDAFDAAIEAVRSWCDQSPVHERIAYRNDLEEEVFVRPQNADWRNCERFLMLQVVAFINRESTEEAWEKLLNELVSDN